VDDGDRHGEAREVGGAVALGKDRGELAPGARGIPALSGDRAARGDADVLVVLEGAVARPDAAKALTRPSTGSVAAGRRSSTSLVRAILPVRPSPGRPMIDTSDSTRDGWRMASSCATREPIEAPATWAPRGATCATSPAASSAIAPSV